MQCTGPSEDEGCGKHDIMGFSDKRACRRSSPAACTHTWTAHRRHPSSPKNRPSRAEVTTLSVIVLVSLALRLCRLAHQKSVNRRGSDPTQLKPEPLLGGHPKQSIRTSRHSISSSSTSL